MTPERLVLDTNIVTDLLKKVPAVVERFLALLEAQTTFIISPIVVAEVAPYLGGLGDFLLNRDNAA